MLKFTLPCWPPTQNHGLAYVKGRLLKSAKRREFDSEVERWSWANRKPLGEARALAESTEYLGLRLIFCAPAKKFLTLTSRSKKIDIDNRIKGLTDAFAKAACFDDSKIWEILARKMIVPSGEFVEIILLDLNDPGA